MIINLAIVTIVVLLICVAFFSQRKQLSLLGLKSSRIKILDIIKGIAILNIIFIHSLWWTVAWHSPALLKQLSLLLDVPVFFLLSGWAVKSQQPTFKSFMGRFSQIYVPYVFFGGIVISCLIFFHHVLTPIKYILSWLYFDFDALSGLPISKWVFVFYTGGLWYIKSFFILLFFTPFLRALDKRKTVGIVFCLCVLGTIVLFEFTDYGIENYLIAGIWSVKYLVFFILFYFLGMMTSTFTLNVKGLIASVMVILGLFLFYCKYFHAMPINLQEEKFPPTLFYLICSSFSIVLVLFVKKYEYLLAGKNNFIIKGLIFLGQKVYAIYLMQHLGSLIMNYTCIYLLRGWNSTILIPIGYLINVISSVGLAILIDPVNQYLIRKVNAFVATGFLRVKSVLPMS